jgi:1-carboxybiuret hydrolase subunit AtzG-like protein
MAKKRAKSTPKNRAKASKAKTSKAKTRTAKASKAKTGSKSKVPRTPTRHAANPLDALVDASARALALPLDRAWRSGIKGNLEVTLRLAALFADFPLPDDAEPAPVFVA